MDSIRNYRVIKDTNNHDYVANKITIIEAAIFSTLTDASKTLHGTLISITFPAGMTLQGNFTSVTLVSGAIVASRIT